MEELRLLKEFNETIISIYNQEKLYPLRGYKDSFELPNGKQILVWQNEITRHRNCHFAPNNFDYNSIVDDLLFISDEIVYFTAHLYLYKPHINTPMKDAYMTPNGTWIYPVFQNYTGKRYEMYINVCYEKLYNYWDRIGDLIASFFPSVFTGNIYFPKVMQSLKTQYVGNTDFDWLLDFSETEYKTFNEVRIKTVHKIAINTEIKWQQLGHVTDEQKSRELTEKILAYPDYFKKMNQLCIEGFTRTLSFLEHVNKIEGYRCN